MPIFYDIYLDIKEKILSGQLGIGSLLPAEKALEEIYNASRAPVRQALGKLENEGLIERRPGKGTFVADRSHVRFLLQFGGFGEQIIRDWDMMSYNVLSIDLVKPGPAVVEHLNIGEDENVICIRKIRSRGDTVVFYMHIYISDQYDITILKKEGNFELYELLNKRFGVDIYSAKEFIYSTFANKDAAEVMKIRENSHLLELYRINCEAGNRPVYLTHYYVRSDIWNYQVSYNANVFNHVRNEKRKIETTWWNK